MWIFFGQLCQTFRLSSAFVFGIGRGMLALGSVAGTLTLVDTTFLDALTPFGPYSGILFYMAALVIAYMFLPRVRDVKRMIDPTFEHRRTPLDDINDEMDELDAVVRDKQHDSSPLSTISDSGRKTLTQAEADTALGMRMTSSGELIDADTLETIDAANAPHALAQGNAESTSTENAEDAENERKNDAGIAKTASSQVQEQVQASSTAASAAANVTHRSEKKAASPTRTARSSNGRTRTSETADAGERKGGGRFRTQCETIANRYLLSRRETEVLFLLAKGHNAAYIQKKLCITQSTAKTHIYHIYQKLDIHTQQELLAMISDGEEGAE